VSRIIVHRPARTPGPAVHREPLAVAPPPQQPPPPPAGPASYLPYVFPAVGSLGSLIFILANPRPLFIVGGILFASTAIMVGVGLAIQQRSAAGYRRNRDRVKYLEYLDTVRARLRGVATEQVAAGRWAHPDPESLWQVAGWPRRLWERRRRDVDFLDVRVGVGGVPLARTLQLDTGASPLADVDPVCLGAAERLVDAHVTVPDQPVTLPLAGIGTLSVVGPAEEARGVARALLAQIVTWHAPEDVRIALAVGPRTAAAWTWVKWLPHARHPEAHDPAGAARLLADDPGELRSLLLPELETRRRRRKPSSAAGDLPASGHLVVVVDRGEPTPTTGDRVLDAALEAGAGQGLTVVHVADSVDAEPSHVDTRLRVDAGGTLRVEPLTGAGPDLQARADLLSPADAETLARRLAPLRLSPESAGGASAETADLPRSLGFDPATLDPAQAWAHRVGADFLRVPIGVSPEGRPVHLDLKESALGGMGPHGLAVGATGSGKSELLRTLVLALAATHPPDRLNLVLVDFKGGATFAEFAVLPHVAGVITNLQDDLALVDRMHDALLGEMQRRQERLRATGYAAVRDYEEARASGASLEPLPSLLVIVDEFSELLSAKPDFIDMFVALGRLGRSLGMHLLLASQRLEEGRLRGLDSHLSYRIGLRTFSATESRAVLGAPDAYELPPVPGSGYLKVDTSVYQRFSAAYVSGPMRRPAPREQLDQVPGILPFTAANLRGTTEETPTFDASSPDEDEPTVLETVVARLRDAGSRAHQVWLPPLDVPPTLDHLLPGVDAHPQRGLAATGWPDHGGLRVPVGIVDRPLQQSLEHLVLDLSGAGGNVAVVGGPRSGKSTALRTLVGALALTHTPEEVQVYAIDLGGGLISLDGFPHVGTVASRLEPQLVRRVLSELAALLLEREQRFRVAGIDSAAAMRALRHQGGLADEPMGDVLLLVDGWAAFRHDFEDLEPAVIDLAARGLAYGIHVVLAANRWFDFRPQLKDTLGTRLELRIGDPIESEVDRKEAANVPADRPGRGLTTEKLHLQLALPRVDGVPSADGLPEATAKFGAAASAAWPGGAGAPPVRVLPTRVPLSALPAPGADTAPGVPVGLGEAALGPLYVDLAGADPHFLVFGDGQSGKTTFLRTYLHGLVSRCRPDEARVIVVDYRRTLLDVVPETHLLAYAGAAPALDPIVTDLHGSLNRRLPGPEVTAAQLRQRSWWTGPEVYLVVDDYDLVVTASGNPLGPLVELLAQARDVGLHVIVARRVGGASRSFFEPMLQRLKELATPGLILSGDKSEGALIGAHRAEEQPAGRGLLVGRGTRAQLIQVATDDLG